jgi:hypothetical protein
MKRLTVTICLTIAVLLGSTGVSFALPKCPSDQNQTYENCFGTYTFADDSKYVGEFRNDKRDGQGTLTFTDGDKYVGEFRNDKRNGQGTATYAMSGNKYVGEWRNDTRNGQGTYTHADGRIKEGIWKNDVFLYAQKVSPQRKLELQQTSYGQKCQEIGFTPKTEKFGDCILRLMEIQSNNRPQTVNETKVREDREDRDRQLQVNRQLQVIREQNYKACVKTHCSELKFGDTCYWSRKYCIR